MSKTGKSSYFGGPSKTSKNGIYAKITKTFFNGVISDNRFGLSTKKVPCVFVTHQLQIQSPIFTDGIQKFNYQYIDKYNACWVMDDEKINLAGNLSKPNILPNNSAYIGPEQIDVRHVSKLFFKNRQ